VRHPRLVWDWRNRLLPLSPSTGGGLRLFLGKLILEEEKRQRREKWTKEGRVPHGGHCRQHSLCTLYFLLSPFSFLRCRTTNPSFSHFASPSTPACRRISRTAEPFCWPLHGDDHIDRQKNESPNFDSSISSILFSCRARTDSCLPQQKSLQGKPLRPRRGKNCLLKPCFERLLSKEASLLSILSLSLSLSLHTCVMPRCALYSYHTFARIYENVEGKCIEFSAQRSIKIVEKLMKARGTSVLTMRLNIILWGRRPYVCLLYIYARSCFSDGSFPL